MMADRSAAQQQFEADIARETVLGHERTWVFGRRTIVIWHVAEWWRDGDRIVRQDQKTAQLVFYSADDDDDSPDFPYGDPCSEDALERRIDSWARRQE